MKIKSPSKMFRAAGRQTFGEWLCFAAIFIAAGSSLKLMANPTGMTVGLGSATVQTSGAQLNVTVSQAAFLNWSSFNIQAGETTTFIQPSANSVVLNEIGGANPSQIFGNLNANGTVILANANGFYFGSGSMIKVGGDFIATTAPITPDFGSGSSWSFTGMPPLASIINYGSIQAGNGRSLFLIAENIQNNGSLNAPGGNIGLAAGQTVLVSERPDGRGLSASVQVPAGAVNNLGQITADAGTIALQAEVVNQNGIIQANSVQNQNGVIELVASDQLNLGPNSQITANGDESPDGSSGGHVTLQSGNIFSDSVGSQISVVGGAQGGNGGSIEISAPNVASLNSSMEASAQNGGSAGIFLLDPASITLGTSSANGMINVNTAFAGFSQIILQATGNITLSGNTTWDLSASTGQTVGQLTLQAGGDIIFGNKSKIFDANDWSVSLYAGYDFVNNVVQSGTGNIYLNGGAGLTQSGTIQLSTGDINLFAGQSILVAPMNSLIVSGSIFTTGGGNIFAYAMAGDIVAGNSNGSANGNTQTTDYNFTDTGWTPNPFLGGISTAAGGNVTLIAGNNIDSTPKVPSSQAPGASGAYGAGDVTVIAGNQITGNYTVTDGAGRILAGVPVSSTQAAILQNPSANASAYATTLYNLVAAVEQSQNPGGNVGAAPVNGNPSTAPVTLGLTTGSWNVWAANDISIKQVINPNGAFNSSQSFAYNYAPDAAVNFWAGNAIELVGGSLGTAASSVRLTPIYAPTLSLNAGVGGIAIDKSIILAPSPEGSLTIITRDGGNLSSLLSGAVSTTPTLNGITMSDSGSTAYTDYATGHAATPLHLYDPNPVMVDISGSINNFSLVVPTFAEINVVGDTYNFGFQGQNLGSSQATSINVGQTAKVNMENLGLLNPATDSGLMVGGNITYQPFSVANENVTLGNQGLTLAGPGTFNITADSIDLGVSGGIRVLAPDAALAAISPYGANLNVTTSGNLGMTSTKIANESYLGGINLIVGGTLDVGGAFTTFGDPGSPKGIFTTSGGNVTVTANGDVNVDGSRIAAYDGGNITVESLTGNVNAGNGGAGYVSMNVLELDPHTGQLVSLPATISGSGILATTVFRSHALLGNILVEAPNGNISASRGGIIQISFNASDASQAAAELLAGYELQDGNGNRVLAENLASGTPVLALSDQNVVNLGSTVQVLPSGSSVPVSLTQVLDVHGNPLLDASGHPLYVKTSDASRQLVEFVNGGLKPFLDAVGDPVNVAEPLEASGNSTLVLGRNIDTSGSGVIAQKIIVKATGGLGGLYVTLGSSPPIIQANNFLPGPDGIGPVFYGSPPIINTTDPNPGPDPIIVSDAGSSAPPPAEVAKTDAPTADTAETVATKTENQDDGLGGDENKKKGNGIALTRKTDRVTVILPPKNSAKSQVPNPGT